MEWKETVTGNPAAWSPPILRSGDIRWRIADADRLAVIIDAADYFAAAGAAMSAAGETILLIGCDFDLRIELGPDAETDGVPTSLGPFLKHLVRHNPRLRIRT